MHRGQAVGSVTQSCPNPAMLPFLSKSRITAAWKQRDLQVTTWKRLQVRDKHDFHLPGLLRCSITIFRHSPNPFPEVLVGHTPAGFGDTWLRQQASSENV